MKQQEEICPILEIAQNRGLNIHNIDGRLIISTFYFKERVIKLIDEFEKAQGRKARIVVFVSKCATDMRLAEFYANPKELINSYFFGANPVKNRPCQNQG